jgi:hypothetical protein
MNPSDSWYYARDGAQQGPVSGEDLQRLAATGVLRAHDLVWREGMAEWHPAQQATGFFQAPAPPPPSTAYVPPQAYAPAPPPAAHYGPPPGYGPPGAQPPGHGAPYAGYAAQQPQSIGADAGMRMLLPVGRSGWAIAAGYLGLFSLFGGCVGPIAIVISIIAIRDIKTHPDRHGMGRAIFGLVLGIVGTIMLALILIGMFADASGRGGW